MSFPSVVAGGPDACTIHYSRADKVCHLHMLWPVVLLHMIWLVMLLQETVAQSLSHWRMTNAPLLHCVSFPIVCAGWAAAEDGCRV